MFQVKTDLESLTFCGRSVWVWKAIFEATGELASRPDARFAVEGMANDLPTASAELQDAINITTVRLERLGFAEVKC